MDQWGAPAATGGGGAFHTGENDARQYHHPHHQHHQPQQLYHQPQHHQPQHYQPQQYQQQYQQQHHHHQPQPQQTEVTDVREVTAAEALGLIGVGVDDPTTTQQMHNMSVDIDVEGGGEVDEDENEVSTEEDEAEGAASGDDDDDGDGDEHEHEGEGAAEDDDEDGDENNDEGGDGDEDGKNEVNDEDRKNDDTGRSNADDDGGDGGQQRQHDDSGDADDVPYVTLFPRKQTPTLAALYAEHAAVTEDKLATHDAVMAARHILEEAQRALEEAEAQDARKGDAVKEVVGRVREAEMVEPCMWNDRMAELREFHSEHGHVDVPYEMHVKKGDKYYKLALFAKRARMLKSNGKLLRYPHRVRALEDLGFKWVKAQWTLLGDKRIEKLRAFRDEHGHCRASRKVHGENPYRLCMSLRTKLADHRDGIKRHFVSPLTEHQAAQLEELFKDEDFGSQGLRARQRTEAVSFDTRLEQFLEHRKKTGHCVPPDENLKAWTSRARALRRGWLAREERAKESQQQGDGDKTTDDANAGDGDGVDGEAAEKEDGDLATEAENGDGANSDAAKQEEEGNTSDAEKDGNANDDDGDKDGGDKDDAKSKPTKSTTPNVTIARLAKRCERHPETIARYITTLDEVGFCWEACKCPGAPKFGERSNAEACLVPAAIRKKEQEIKAATKKAEKELERKRRMADPNRMKRGFWDGAWRYDRGLKLIKEHKKQFGHCRGIRRLHDEPMGHPMNYLYNFVRDFRKAASQLRAGEESRSRLKLTPERVQEMEAVLDGPDTRPVKPPNPKPKAKVAKRRTRAPKNLEAFQALYTTGNAPPAAIGTSTYPYALWPHPPPAATAWAPAQPYYAAHGQPQPPQPLPFPALFELNLEAFKNHRLVTGHCDVSGREMRRWLAAAREQKRELVAFDMGIASIGRQGGRKRRYDFTPNQLTQLGGAGLCWTAPCSCPTAPKGNDTPTTAKLRAKQLKLYTQRLEELRTYKASNGHMKPSGMRPTLAKFMREIVRDGLQRRGQGLKAKTEAMEEFLTRERVLLLAEIFTPVPAGEKKGAALKAVTTTENAREAEATGNKKQDKADAEARKQGATSPAANAESKTSQSKEGIENDNGKNTPPEEDEERSDEPPAAAATAAEGMDTAAAKSSEARPTAFAEAGGAAGAAPTASAGTGAPPSDAAPVATGTAAGAVNANDSATTTTAAKTAPVPYWADEEARNKAAAKAKAACTAPRTKRFRGLPPEPQPDMEKRKAAARAFALALPDLSLTGLKPPKRARGRPKGSKLAGGTLLLAGEEKGREKLKRGTASFVEKRAREAEAEEEGGGKDGKKRAREK